MMTALQKKMPSRACDGRSDAEQERLHHLQTSRHAARTSIRARTHLHENSGFESGSAACSTPAGTERANWS